MFFAGSLFYQSRKYEVNWGVISFFSLISSGKMQYGRHRRKNDLKFSFLSIRDFMMIDCQNWYQVREKKRWGMFGKKMFPDKKCLHSLRGLFFNEILQGHAQRQ